MKTHEEASKILEILKKDYGEYKCGLDYNTPFELLIAAILSAQCTDKRVNIVTEKLYEKANTPKAIYALGEKGLLEYIRSCGLSNSKCKNILASCKILFEDFSSEVPRTMEELITLPGVGRKVANVVLSNAFDIPAIAVDTHVQRVSNRIGLANSENVLKTEKQLNEIIPKELWSASHHWLIWHGRNVCDARNPKCDECNLKKLCDYKKQNG